MQDLRLPSVGTTYTHQGSYPYEGHSNEKENLQSFFEFCNY